MHKRCLSCNECKMSLDASSFYNGFDGEVYCKYCYATKFGHKQKSTYNPSSIKDVMTIQGEKGDANTCPRCLGKVKIALILFFAYKKCPYWFFFKTKLRYLKLKEWLPELAISIEIVSVALNVTKNWILRLVVKVGIFQNTFYIYSNKG